jgi:hypothetical protein
MSNIFADLTVTPLKWNEYEREGQIDKWDANSGFDTYYNITLQVSGYRVLCPDSEHDCETLDAAKVAAQNDYAVRILSALQRPSTAQDRAA